MADSTEDKPGPSYDLRRLYDGADTGELGGGHLYDATPPMDAKPRPTLLDTDTVIVQNRVHVQDPHGGHYEYRGDPLLVACSVEGHEQQAGMFSISGAEDKSVSDQGGLQEVTPIRILAREWPGDIHSRVWWHGDPYDVDGSPTYFPHSSETARHWEVRARRVVNVALSPDVAERITPPNPVAYA